MISALGPTKGIFWASQNGCIAKVERVSLPCGPLDIVYHLISYFPRRDVDSLLCNLFVTNKMVHNTWTNFRTHWLRKYSIEGWNQSTMKLCYFCWIYKSRWNADCLILTALQHHWTTFQVHHKFLLLNKQQILLITESNYWECLLHFLKFSWEDHC